jgi:hypothetical protein
LLPRDEDVPRGSPTVGIGQLFIAAHKEINKLEQMKTVPPVIDVIAEPVTTDEAAVPTAPSNVGFRGRPADICSLRGFLILTPRRH